MEQEAITNNQRKLHIRDLYPELSDAEQAEAEYYLKGYIEVVRRIFERTSNLTDSDGADTMRMR